MLGCRGDGLLGFAEVVVTALRAPAGDVRGAELVRLYMGYADIGATTYALQGRRYGNRVLARALPGPSTRGTRGAPSPNHGRSGGTRRTTS